MNRINEIELAENGKYKQVKEWRLDTWYEKVIYCFGVLYTILFLIGMIIGFANYNG